MRRSEPDGTGLSTRSCRRRRIGRKAAHAIAVAAAVLQGEPRSPTAAPTIQAVPNQAAARTAVSDP